MSAPLTQVELDAIIVSLKDLQLTRFMQVGGTALIYYEFLCTTGQEVSLFWGHWRAHPFSIPGILFFANRYFVLFAITMNTAALVGTIITDSFCNSFVTIISATGNIQIFLVQLILAVRIDAMYANRKWVTYPLLALWCSTLISATVVSHEAFKDIIGTAHPVPGIIACAPLGVLHHAWAFWIPILVYEATTFVLALYKSITHLRQAMFPGSFGNRLMRTILRDSVLYFFMILSLYMINALLWAFGRDSLLEVIHGFTLALVSLMGSRMLINLREQGRKRLIADGTSGTQIELVENTSFKTSGYGSRATGPWVASGPAVSELHSTERFNY